VLVDGTACATTFVSDTRLDFTVPIVAGGVRAVQVRQQDGTLSNRASLIVRPVITEPAAGQRLRPGERVVLTGSGFAPGCQVRANEQDMPDVQFMSPCILQFNLIRPAVITANPAGEQVMLKVVLPTGEPSNELRLVLDTYRMLVFGDSVLWGQGLQENQKIHTLVASMIRTREGNIGVYADNLAHSGATIGIGDDDVEDTQREASLNGEVPTSYPTILQQVADFTDSPETVDLVLVNGGINDVNVRRILPSVSDDELLGLIDQHCHRHMRILLERITAKFKNAKVVVGGYFSIVSEDTDLGALAALLIGLGFRIGQVNLAFGAAVLNEVVRRGIARNCQLFAEQSEVKLQAAVDEVNTTLINDAGEPKIRVFLAAPEFDRSNAALATHPWLFGINLDLSAQDSMVAGSRRTACEEAPAGRTDVEICKRASIGHPNAPGAEEYAREISHLLGSPSFPPGFLWGAATAGYQVEGSIENNDWHIFTTSPAIRERVQELSILVRLNYDLRPPGEALRHGDLNVLKADLDRARLLGMNAYRFSIEWSRVQPTRAGFDPATLDYYDNAITEMLRRGLKPIVTLNHLTLPNWVLTPPRESSVLSAINAGVAVEDDPFRASLRGWESGQTVDAFVTYVRVVVGRYKGRVDTWITLNEPAGSMIGVGYLGGIWPPGFSLDGNRAKEAYFNLLRAHVRAYDAIKSLYGAQPSLVGIAHAMMHARLTRAGGGLGNVNEAAKNQFDYFYNQHLLDSLIHDVVDTAIQRRPQDRANVSSRDFYNLSSFEPWSARLDFIGINYYRSVYVNYDQVLAIMAGFSGGAFDNDLSGATGHYLLNDLGWEMYPRGLYRIASGLHNDYHLPILITENGMPEAVDRNRAAYTVSHLQQILRACEEGVRVLGYLHWSIVDNFEWQEHYTPRARFGLFTVDRSASDENGVPTLPRHITEAALALQYIIAENGVAEAVERFGAISSKGLVVLPPTRSPGVLWEGSFGNGDALTLYLTRVLAGTRWLGMIFLHTDNTWHRLNEISLSGNVLRFTHRRADGGLALYEATTTDALLSGTMTFAGTSQTWQATRTPLFGNWRSTDGFPVYAHLRRLEGEFDGWRGKFLRAYPDVAWVGCQTVTWDGTTLRFDVGNFGDFQGRLTADGTIDGTISLIGAGGGATTLWRARRLADGVVTGNHPNPKPAYGTFLLQTGTPLVQAEDGNGDFLLADYDRDGVPDLYYIKRRNVGSNSIEVHVLSGASNYQQFTLQTGTLLAPAEDGNGDFFLADYDRDGVPDLYYIKRRNVGSNSIEVHVLSGASNYQQFALQTGTPLVQAEDGNGSFVLADYDRDGVPDLYFVKRRNVASNSIEVHVLGGSYVS
jgi:beta-glucosidase/6-phospho-beta-glucosidase/beta-galactosidase/lysophospholipase L1-like esterase